MSNSQPYEFVPTDVEEIVASLVAAYQQITGRTVHPADPEKIFICLLYTSDAADE